MSKAKKAGRTREHVVGDIAQRHVELLVAEAGFVPLAVGQGTDYGIDLPVLTFDANGEQENGYVLLQIKGADALKVLKSGDVSVTIGRRHLRRWAKEPMPVIVVRFDVTSGTGYWIYVQRWLKTADVKKLTPAGGSLTLRIPQSQTISVAAMMNFAGFKRHVLAQTDGKIDHG